MADRVDLLLTEPSKRAPMRIGDIGTDAPYMILFTDGETANLPMPTSITSANQILWEQADTTAGAGGAMALDAMNKAANKDYWNALKGAGGAIKQVAEDNIAANIGAKAGILNAPDLIAHKRGKAVNPNKEMMFNGVGYRSFTFEFELIPLSESEANQIGEFVKFFQEKAMPDFADQAKSYFAYPGAWDIMFVNCGVWFPKILPAYLTDYSINYAGAGKIVQHKGGNAVQTNISLTFTEAELHMKNKVKSGYIG